MLLSSIPSRSIPFTLAASLSLLVSNACVLKNDTNEESSATTSEPEVDVDTSDQSSSASEATTNDEHDSEDSVESGDSDDSDDDNNDSSQDTEGSDDPGSEDDLPSVEPKWDLEELPDIPEEEDRCTKIDFLFVVDNSRSMEDEQVHLTESFPGFIAGIQDQVSLEDYRIMVVKSDSSSKIASSCESGACTCESDEMPPSEVCCVDRCLSAENMTCASKACTEFPENRECPDRLGTGVVSDSMGNSCNFDSGLRYMLSDQAELEDTFACAATVGTGGNYGELMIDAMLQSLTENNLEVGGCNEGFIREDAILVVVLITDEEEKTTLEDMGSMGNPAEWKTRVMAVKGDNETAVLVAGFIGDTGQPGAICEPMTGNSVDGAQESPRLREFITSFGAEHSLLASVCEPDYAPAFKEMVDKIAVACEDWIPK